MSEKLRVLIVEDSEDDAELLLRELRSGDFELISERVETCEAMADALKRQTWDVIISDYSLPGFNGLQALKLLRSSAFDIPCIIVSGKIGEDTAVQLMKAGANDYVMKRNLKRLASAVERELGDAETRRERKKAEESIKESEERYQLAINATQDGIWEWDIQTNSEYFTPRWCEIIGYAFDDPELLHTYNSWAERTHPDDFERVMSALKNHLEIGTEYDVDYRHRHKSGEYRWQNSKGKAIFDESGKPTKMVGCISDITDRKQAEENLRQSLTELESLHTVSSALRTAQTIEEALPLLLDETLATLETDAGAIWLYHAASGELRIAVARGWFTRMYDIPLKPGEGIAGTVFTSGQAHLTTEFVSDPLANPQIVAKIPAGWGGACVPIRTSAETVGVLFVSMALPRQVMPVQMKLLDSLAQMAGTALHRMRLHAQTVHRLENLQALRAVDHAITASLDLQLVLNILLVHVTAQLKVDAADVLLFHKHLKTLEYTAGRGFRTGIVKTARIRSGEGFAGRAAMERQIVQVLDSALVQEDPHCAALWAGEGFAAYYGVPIIAKGQVKGVLEVFHRTPLTPDPEWEDFIKMLAGQAAIAIDNAQLFENLQRANAELSTAYDATIEGWSRALDLRDNITEGHTLRVTEMTLRLAHAMGITDKELLQIRRGALLHDIGKMGIPDYILLKPGELTEEEWEIMRKHPVHAFEMLSPISYLRFALDIPYCHHEKWDGSGYPRGLKGQDIPLPARLFAVVDVFDALNSDRPYRKAWTREKVLEYICEQRGRHFDPQVVDVFLKEVAG